MEKEVSYSGTTSIAPRTGFSRHQTSASSTSSTRVLKMVTEMGSHSLSGLSPALSTGAATALLESREKEKKEMQDLNDRLAGYIEKVRFLEAQNRKLAEDLEKLRGRWGTDTSSIKGMYEKELADARKMIDDTSRDKNQLESQIYRLQQDITEYRRKYDDLNQSKDDDRDKVENLSNQLSDAEAEISVLRRRIQFLEDDIARLKSENNRVLNELQRTRHDLDQETLNRIDYQNQVQTLLEEIDFVNRVHDQEVKDMQSLIIKDPTREYREYFKDDLAAAIRDIRLEYDNLSQQNKVDMESWYKLKVQEIQTSSNRHVIESSYQREETKRLRNQLGDLRAKLGDLETRNSILEKQSNELTYQLEDDQRQYEAALNERDSQIRKMRDDCQSLMVELQSLLDTKRTLDAEIAIYRKMLEGEENRDGLRQLIDQMMKAHTVRQREDEDGHEYEREDRQESTVRSSSREVSYRRRVNEKGEVEESYTEGPGAQITPKDEEEKPGQLPHHPDMSGSFSRPSLVKKRDSIEPHDLTDRKDSIKEEEPHKKSPTPPTIPTSPAGAIVEESTDSTTKHENIVEIKGGDVPGAIVSSKKEAIGSPTKPSGGTTVKESAETVTIPKQRVVEFKGGEVPAAIISPVKEKAASPEAPKIKSPVVETEPEVTKEEAKGQQSVSKYGHVRSHHTTATTTSTTTTVSKPAQIEEEEIKVVSRRPSQPPSSPQKPELAHHESHVIEKPASPEEFKFIPPKPSTSAPPTSLHYQSTGTHEVEPVAVPAPEATGQERRVSVSKYGHIRSRPSTVETSAERRRSSVEPAAGADAVDSRRPSLGPVAAAAPPLSPKTEEPAGIVISPLHHESGGLGPVPGPDKRTTPPLHYKDGGDLADTAEEPHIPEKETSVVVKQIVTTTAAATKPAGETTHVVKGEMATRTSFQRSAKGNISIAECHPEGKYIVLENTHRSKDENLDGWKIARNVDNKLNLEYEIPPNTVLQAGHSMKIWAKNQGGTHSPPDSYLFDAADSWGVGANVQTILFNKDGEEKATHVQRTSQQSTAESA